MWKEWIEYGLMALAAAVLLTALGVVIWFVGQIVWVFRMAMGG